MEFMAKNRVVVRLDVDRVRSWDHRKLGMPAMELGGARRSTSSRGQPDSSVLLRGLRRWGSQTIVGTGASMAAMSAPDLELAEAAWRWVLDQVRYDDGGPWIPLHTGRDRAGVGPGRDAQRHRRAGARAGRSRRDPAVDRRGAALAAAIGERLRAVDSFRTDVTYFDGLVSHLQCLVLLGEPGVDACVDRLLELAPDGWPDCNDATLGTAAILFGGLTAIEAGSRAAPSSRRTPPTGCWPRRRRRRPA